MHSIKTAEDQCLVDMGDLLIRRGKQPERMLYRGYVCQIGDWKEPTLGQRKGPSYLSLSDWFSWFLSSIVGLKRAAETEFLNAPKRESSLPDNGGPPASDQLSFQWALIGGFRILKDSNGKALNDVLIASLTDTLSEHPELVGAARAGLGSDLQDRNNETIEKLLLMSKPQQKPGLDSVKTSMVNHRFQGSKGAAIDMGTMKKNAPAIQHPSP
ncbi:hypothetical protein J6590_059675 [Homalodisca vitripennis]|nr:hypothetical protein J6590_059675 [Homalodisca vitripennis]